MAAPTTTDGSAAGGSPARGTGGDTKPFRVMVVDDSAVVRGLVTRFLQEDPDLSVVASCGNGQRAVDELKRTPVDVIVLDIEMPVMDGLTALPKLIALSPKTKVISGLLAGLDLAGKGTLLVSEANNPALYKSVRNLQKVDLIERRNLCAGGVLRRPNLLISAESLEAMMQELSA